MSFDFRLTGRHVSFIANINGGFYRNNKQVYAFAYSCDSGSYKYSYTPPGANWIFLVEIPRWSFYKLTILLKLSVDNSWKYLALISGLLNVITWECCPCSGKWNPSLSVNEERNINWLIYGVKGRTCIKTLKTLNYTGSISYLTSALKLCMQVTHCAKAS